MLHVRIESLKVGQRELLSKTLEFDPRPGKGGQLTGANGCGKSVILTWLAGWGKRILDCTVRGVISVKRNFHLPEEYSDYCHYAREHVGYMGHRLDEESLGVTVGEELELIQHSFHGTLPNIVKEVLYVIESNSSFETRIESLAGGYRQLLALVDVLSRAAKYDCILLDEPWSYMSPTTRFLADHLLKWAIEANPSCKIIVTSHIKASHSENFEKIEFPTAYLPDQKVNIPALQDAIQYSHKIREIGISIKGEPINGHTRLPFFFDHNIDPNESVVTVGSNGSGKTTLLRTVGGLYKVRGKILYCDTTGTNVPKRKLYPHLLGYMFQEPHIYEFRNHVAELLQIPTNIPQKARKAYEAFNDSIYNSYGIFKDQHPCTLSSGQLRILWILSLLGWASRWILDEPDASLDKRSKQLLRTIIELHVENHGTFIAATHNPAMFRSLKSTQMNVNGAYTVNNEKRFKI